MPLTLVPRHQALHRQHRERDQNEEDVSHRFLPQAASPNRSGPAGDTPQGAILSPQLGRPGEAFACWLCRDVGFCRTGYPNNFCVP